MLKIFENINEYIEMNRKDKSYLGKLSDDLAEDLYNLIDDLISAEDEFFEQFISSKDELNHYKKHCINGYANRKSRKQHVFYDFKNQNDFNNYESLINNKCKNPDSMIGSLYSSVEVVNSIRKLFEGNYTIEFTTSCGFYNNNGPIIVCLNSFASNVTTNYTAGNTINVCILSKTFKTISMYAVDGLYLEHQFNRIMKNYTNNKQIKFAWNH